MQNKKMIYQYLPDCHRVLKYLAAIAMVLQVMLVKSQTSDHSQLQQEHDAKLEELTKALVQTFLIEEDTPKLGEMIDDSLVFHWPQQSTINKEQLLQVCTALTNRHENTTDIIDLAVDGDKVFIMFLWSGTVINDDNPKIVGKTFAVHDFWHLTWKNEKVIEWYAIWGSENMLRQLGYEISAP